MKLVQSTVKMKMETPTTFDGKLRVIEDGVFKKPEINIGYKYVGATGYHGMYSPLSSSVSASVNAYYMFCRDVLDDRYLFNVFYEHSVGINATLLDLGADYDGTMDLSKIPEGQLVVESTPDQNTSGYNGHIVRLKREGTKQYYFAYWYNSGNMVGRILMVDLSNNSITKGDRKIFYAYSNSSNNLYVVDYVYLGENRFSQTNMDASGYLCSSMYEFNTTTLAITYISGTRYTGMTGGNYSSYTCKAVKYFEDDTHWYVNHTYNYSSGYYNNRIQWKFAKTGTAAPIRLNSNQNDTAWRSTAYYFLDNIVNSLGHLFVLFPDSSNDQRLTVKSYIKDGSQFYPTAPSATYVLPDLSPEPHTYWHSGQYLHRIKEVSPDKWLYRMGYQYAIYVIVDISDVSNVTIERVNSRYAISAYRSYDSSVNFHPEMRSVIVKDKYVIWAENNTRLHVQDYTLSDKADISPPLGLTSGSDYYLSGKIRMKNLETPLKPGNWYHYDNTLDTLRLLEPGETTWSGTSFRWNNKIVPTSYLNPQIAFPHVFALTEDTVIITNAEQG